MKRQRHHMSGSRTAGSCKVGRRIASWSLATIGLLLCAACEPRTIEIQGLEELTSEIRSQRLLQQSQAESADIPVAGRGAQIQQAQIQQAMAPLRDVLTQLGTSQRELSTRQATLTQEMRRWTQLLVQSMNSERNQEAVQLGERLAELEKTIAQQDVRHRQVEELLGSALDHTADQLEDFLKRLGAPVGADVGTAVQPPAADSVVPTPGLQPGERSAESKPANANGQAKSGERLDQSKSATNAASSGDLPTPSGAGGAAGGGAKRGSMAWLWGLAGLSLISGFTLLFGRRRRDQLRIAPEMQVTPPFEPAFEDPASQDPIPEDYGYDPAANDAAKAPDTDKPEIEGLWAAAALLGEAIDRLKLTGEAMPPELGGAQALPEAPTYSDANLGSDLGSGLDEAHKADLVLDDLDDVFVLEDDDELQANEPAALEPPAFAAGADEQAAPALHVEDSHVPDIHVPDSSAHVEAFAPAPTSMVAEATGSDVAPHVVRQPASRHASSSPVTCRLLFPASQHAEGRLRSLLGSDPRVLVTPAPEVRNAMGELEVSFAMLPGLAAGERSLLEQQLRDSVA